ncbi:BamA/OMP85 family outer membrane protein [Gemmatimonas groenlandica]|uniref:BamA/TamA family outer membrane protein n=1 Tax=Gemmatimonas groenlandica TaxID=2732249 RepID=A0A6M4IPH1_9BACT|nr:BamA/TamA family outer membrane protein [Gemmatimonas groenlandica]QJR34161.1 BamA/TamA family outer membrane protein [Gemmatimonas groenlandica]
MHASHRSHIGAALSDFAARLSLPILLTILLLVPSAARLGAQQSSNREQGGTQRESPEIRELRITGITRVPEGDLRASLASKASSCRSLLLKPFCWITKSRYIYERSYLDRDEFQRDVLRALVFYFRRGYRDAAIDTSVVRVGTNAVRITMSVREGPPTRVASTGIISTIPVPIDSARLIRPRVNEPLSLLAIDSTVARVRDALWELGFADATIAPVTNVDSAADSASLRFRVDPKRRVSIGEIKIEGAEKIAERDIRRSLRVEPGDVFRRSRITRSQRALYESALFRRATIDTLPHTAGAPDSVKSLVVRVIEAPQREARASVGFTTADFVQAEAQFTHNYWLGGTRKFDATLTVGNLLAQQLTRSPLFVNFTNISRGNELGRFYSPTYQASVDARQRWFQSPRNTIGAGIFSHRRSSPGVFVDRGYGASATFTRELGIRMPASATYRFEISSVEAGDVYFCVNYGVCDGSTIQALRGQQRLSPAAVTVSTDRSDAPLSPTRGVRFRAEAEHASALTASDFRYNRATADIAVYRPLPFRRIVAALHLRAGWVQPISGTAAAVGLPGAASGAEFAEILHPRKRFYAGGAQSVRGFGENQLGPRVLTIAPDVLRGRTVTDGDTTFQCAPSTPITSCSVNAASLRDSDFQVRPLGGTTLLEGSVELRVPVWRSVVGAVFLDGAILGEGTLNSITRGTGALTPGFGVRYESPVGPIRVDLGLRPTLRRALPVITQTTDSLGQSVLVALAPVTGCGAESTTGCRTFPDPAERLSFLRKLTNRLTLHLSIGQAF